MGNDGGEADPQHSPGIPNTRTVHRHIDNLVGHAGFVGFIQVLQLEAMVAIPAAVALKATAGFAMPVDQLTLTGRTFHQNACHQYLTRTKSPAYRKSDFNSSKSRPPFEGSVGAVAG